MTSNPKPIIHWDWGTAYDLFASLHVLHHPEKFGLRGSWAAGVRSRLTVPQRTILEDSQKLFFSSSHCLGFECARTQGCCDCTLDPGSD